MRGRPSREVLALLPWLAAAVVWFGVVSPMRADQENRLNQQSRIRRERVKAERELRAAETLRARIARALATACRASSDPAALRQRTVAAGAGLPLSPFSLTVTGGPDGGATVDASGPRALALELLRRLGDPARGGFLRGASVRDRGGNWGVSAATGVFESFPGGILPAPSVCAGASEPPPAEASPEIRAPRPAPGPGPLRKAPPSATPETAAPMPVIERAPDPPFTLVAFLISKGKSRVSIRVRDEVRVISVGDSVEDWKCVSIDSDEGAVFTTPGHGRVVLKAGTSER